MTTEDRESRTLGGRPSLRQPGDPDRRCGWAHGFASPSYDGFAFVEEVEVLTDGYCSAAGKGPNSRPAGIPSQTACCQKRRVKAGSSQIWHAEFPPPPVESGQITRPEKGRGKRKQPAGRSPWVASLPSPLA